MLQFIVNNLGNIAVSAILLFFVGGVIYYMVKDKKEGKSSCGCNCSGCAMKGACHSGHNGK